MNKGVSVVVAGCAVLTGMLLAGATIKPSVPTRTADEAITVTLKNGSVTQTLTAWTGNPRSSQSSDDIQLTLESKLQKIADAINFGPQTGGSLTASVTGSTISVTSDDPNSSITKISITNSTAQASNQIAIGSLAQNESLNAEVSLAGAIWGSDDAGSASTVMVGTARGTVSVSPADFTSIEAMVDDIVRRLVQIGVSASIEANTARSVLLTMSPTLDEYVAFGCTDAGLEQFVVLKRR